MPGRICIKATQDILQITDSSMSCGADQSIQAAIVPLTKAWSARPG